MPEGPSIVLLKEQASAFAGRRILRVDGNTSIAKERLQGRKIEQLRSNTPLALTGSLRVYVFVQDAAVGPGPGQVIAQVLRVDLVNGNKELLASSGPAAARAIEVQPGAGNVAGRGARGGKS